MPFAFNKYWNFNQIIWDLMGKKSNTSKQKKLIEFFYFAKIVLLKKEKNSNIDYIPALFNRTFYSFASRLREQ